jgi:mutator protein MutT
MHLDDVLRDQIQRALARFEVQSAPHGPHHASAVALTLVEEGMGADIAGFTRPAGWSRAAALLLTRRAATLRRHASQWALPGGRIDEGETPEQAALRELHEEVGLAIDPTQILGRLDDFVTRSGYVITPLVVWGGAARELRPNPEEVASIHRIRISEFMRPDAPILQPSDDPERQVLRMPVGVAGGGIWAPTAALVYQFREVCLMGRTTRVAHYDQPLFARR